MKNRVLTTVTAAILSGSLLVACGDSETADTTNDATATDTVTSEETTTETETTTEEADATETVAAATASEEIRLENGVVRAKGTDKGMTGIFGTVVNDTDEDIEIVEVYTNLDAGLYEIHETVDGTMREMEEPFLVEANSTRELVPGGDHFMIMEYEPEIPAGDLVQLTVVLADGTELDFGEILVEEMNPGDEDYGEDGGLVGHSPSGDAADEHAGH